MRKRIKSILLIAIVAISMMMLGGSVSAQQLPRLYVWPSQVIRETDIECEYNNTQFKVEVKIANVTDCYGVDFWLYYNSTLLSQVGGVSVGTYGVPFPSGNPPIIPPQGGGYVLTELSAAGVVRVSLTFVGAVGADSFNGTGTVVEITFQIIYCPEQIVGEPQQNNTVWSDLAFDETKVKIYNRDGSAKPRLPSFDGYYRYTTIGKVPGAPVADFTWIPTVPYESDDVTLTSTSTPNGGNIIAYLWTITNVTGSAHLTGPDNTSSTTMHCDGEGTVDVTLTVWDDEGLNGTVTKTIDQLARIGCIIDVYTSPDRFCGQVTDYVGKGVNENADAFAPGDNMTVYVEVTYNGAPVNHLLVAVEVLWEYEELPDQTLIFRNDTITYRVIETNKDGIASFQMRIPLPICEQPPYYPFGKWIIVASAKVQSVKQEDQLRFDVNYILRVHDAWTTYGGEPDNVFYRDSDWMDVHIVIKSIAWMWKHVYIAIVAFDECEVPIGQALIPWEVPPGAYCNPSYTVIDIFDVIHIPQWAWVGAGWVYINLFTAPPSECGVAYAPETALPIIIKLGPRP